MTRRAPQRSTSQPIAGQDNAASAACIVNAEETIARPTPRSAVIGFRKTPNAKTLTAPPPTMRPQTVANTIHQRFAKMPRIGRSSLCTWPTRPGALLASLCGRRVAGKARSRTAGEGDEPARVSRVRVFRAAYTFTRPRPPSPAARERGSQPLSLPRQRDHDRADQRLHEIGALRHDRRLDPVPPQLD